LILIFCFSCDDKTTFRNYKSVGESWDSKNIIKFQVPKTDINKTSKYNIFIHLRNNDKYLFSNIFLIATIKNRFNIIARDTLEYSMASAEGKWLGKGFLNLKESKLFWKKNYNFFENDSIIIEIEQAVRKIGSEFQINYLEGIVDVGVSVEEYN